VRRDGTGTAPVPGQHGARLAVVGSAPGGSRAAGVELLPPLVASLEKSNFLICYRIVFVRLLSASAIRRRGLGAMRHHGIIVGVACALFLGGCSVTLPVRGSVENTGEKFTGSATGDMDGAGNLQIAFASGRTCSGEFVYVTHRQGEGTFECSDGATGPFSFVSTGTRGTGSGTLRGDQFTFTFGP
jgi:hypothetical protein